MFCPHLVDTVPSGRRNYDCLYRQAPLQKSLRHTYQPGTILYLWIVCHHSKLTLHLAWKKINGCVPNLHFESHKVDSLRLVPRGLTSFPYIRAGLLLRWRCLHCAWPT